jgi:DNA-binding LacI/PurR family transcriptional regulator
MTMRELAKLANVSASTVSKAFRDAPDVSDETKELIFDIAKKHGCFHKFRKEKFSKFIIAIICPEIKSPYYAGYVERLQDIINKNGGIALVSADSFDLEKQEELISYYAEFLKVDGIIVFQMMTSLKKSHSDTPIVAIFSSKDVGVDSVRLDFEQPLKQAVEHLHKTGCEHIAFISEQLTMYKAEKFEKIARCFPIKHSIISVNRRFEEAGQQGAKKLLDFKNIPTGIICAYDDIAMGAIKVLNQRGYKIPDDFSVIGIDNNTTSSYLETPLSTIDTRPDEVCMIAWDLLEKKRKNRYYKLNQQIKLTGELLLRETTKKKL